MDLELLPVGVGAACVFAVEASFSFPFPFPVFWALWLPNSSINSSAWLFLESKGVQYP